MSTVCFGEVFSYGKRVRSIKKAKKNNVVRLKICSKHFREVNKE
jgi:hypothetical protein